MSPLSERRRYALALVAGLTWALSFPLPGIAGLGWLVPGLLLGVAAGCPAAATFRIGYAAGLVQQLASLYWILLIPIQLSADVGWFESRLYRLGPVVGWLSMSAVLALYPAAWVWFCWRVFSGRLGEGESGFTGHLDRFLGAGWAGRVRWALICGVAWVAMEMVQTRFLSGFPWNLLGASQYRMLPVIQIASVTGVYGVSFLLAWFSVSLLGAVAGLTRQSAQRGHWLADLFLPMACVAIVFGLGMRKLQQPSAEGPGLKVALIQPSIPQTTIWDEQASSNRFRAVVALSTEAVAAAKPDLLVWPEAAVPGYVRWDTNINMVITNLALSNRVWLVLGADDLVPAARPRHRDDYEFYNSSFLVNPQGEFAAGYRKRKLVMFGEYVPLARWLPFLKYLTPIQGGFTPGHQVVQFVLPDLGVKTAVLICFEDTFPHLVREYVEVDTDFLLNLTNNGWFGESAAQWQHAANAVFRAVENGVPLVRCANNGLTCWVDAWGRMHEVYFPNTNNIYGAGFKTARIPTLDGRVRVQTFYQRHGDVFGWGCVGLTAALLAGVTIGRRRDRHATA